MRNCEIYLVWPLSGLACPYSRGCGVVLFFSSLLLCIGSGAAVYIIALQKLAGRGGTNLVVRAQSEGVTCETRRDSACLFLAGIFVCIHFEIHI